MRKPLVVVCAAAATALVLAGGVAAPAAQAGETPDGPGFDGFSWWPGFGDDSGEWGWSAGSGSSGTAADDASSDGSLFGDAADGSVSDGSAADDGSTIDDSAADDGSVSGDSASDGAASDGAASDGAASDGAASDDSALDDAAGDGSGSGDATGSGSASGDSAANGSASRGSHAGGSFRSKADARPARPLAQRQANAGGAARQRPATTLATSARRAVTSADVTSSPSSPVQQQLLALMNQSRRTGRCDALSVDRRLIDAANEHAADMARRRYFAHESPNGDSAGDRVSEAGYRWKRYGENIARGADSAYEVWNGWMHSPEHRHNILDCRLHEMGIGLALSGDGTPYWVQDFATPMS